MADAALAGYELLGEEAYLTSLRRAHAWFRGGNSEGLVVGIEREGACYDGLMAGGVNRNQGAESTLAFLWTSIILAEGAMAKRQRCFVQPGHGAPDHPEVEDTGPPALSLAIAPEEPTRG